MVTVIQNPVNGDFTGFSFNPQSADTFALSFLVDEGVRTFLVSPNNPISLQAILSQNYSEIDGFFGGPSYQTFTEGIPFYLGFYTGYNPFGITNINGHATGYYTGIYTDPVFGWGEFVNNGGVIQMLDSALEIQGGGIYAGTQTIIPVPEPSTFALVGLGGLAFGLFKKRQIRLFLRK
jgi:hypothetical protein